MINRRDLLKWSAVAPVLLGGSAASFRKLPEGVDALVLDTRHVRRGLAGPMVHAFDGDVTQLWFETLDPLWRRPGFVLGGITGADALFVLKRLAWDRGRRVVSRSQLPARHGSGTGPLSWVIAPVHPSVKV